MPHAKALSLRDFHVTQGGATDDLPRQPAGCEAVRRLSGSHGADAAAVLPLGLRSPAAPMGGAALQPRSSPAGGGAAQRTVSDGAGAGCVGVGTAAEAHTYVSGPPAGYSGVASPSRVARCEGAGAQSPGVQAAERSGVAALAGPGPLPLSLHHDSALHRAAPRREEPLGAPPTRYSARAGAGGGSLGGMPLAPGSPQPRFSGPITVLRRPLHGASAAEEAVAMASPSATAPPQPAQAPPPPQALPGEPPLPPWPPPPGQPRVTAQQLDDLLEGKARQAAAQSAAIAAAMLVARASAQPAAPPGAPSPPRGAVVAAPLHEPEPPAAPAPAPAPVPAPQPVAPAPPMQPPATLLAALSLSGGAAAPPALSQPPSAPRSALVDPRPGDGVGARPPPMSVPISLGPAPAPPCGYAGAAATAAAAPSASRFTALKGPCARAQSASQGPPKAAAAPAPVPGAQTLAQSMALPFLQPPTVVHSVLLTPPLVEAAPQPPAPPQPPQPSSAAGACSPGAAQAPLRPPLPPGPPPPGQPRVAVPPPATHSALLDGGALPAPVPVPVAAAPASEQPLAARPKLQPRAPPVLVPHLPGQAPARPREEAGAREAPPPQKYRPRAPEPAAQAQQAPAPAPQPSGWTTVERLRGGTRRVSGGAQAASSAWTEPAIPWLGTAPDPAWATQGAPGRRG